MLALLALTTTLALSNSPAPTVYGPVTASVRSDTELIVEGDVDPLVATCVRSFVQTVRRGGVADFREELDVDSMLDRTEVHIGERLGRIERRVLEQQLLDPLLAKTLTVLVDSIGDQPAAVRKQESTPHGTHTVVLRMRHTPGTGDSYAILELVEDADGFAVSDIHIEDALSWVSVQLAQMHAMLSEKDASELERLIEYSEKLNSALAAQEVGDFETVLTRLSRLESEARALGELSYHGLRLLQLTFALALERAELVVELSKPLTEKYPNASYPWFAYGRSALLLERPAEARALFDQYQQLVGSDAVSRGFCGDAFEQEGDVVSAIAEWRAALDGDADLVDPLYSLGTQLEADELDELVTRFRARTDGGASLELLLDAWSNQGYCDAVRVLSAACREDERPNANAWYFEALCALWSEDFADAARLAREGAKHAPRLEVDAYDAIWILAQLELVPAIEVYRGAIDQELAFSLACQHVSADPVDLDQLARLIEARVEDGPQDPWLPFYRGELLHLSEEYAEAETHYAQGFDSAAAAGDDEAAGEYRLARAWNLYLAGEGAQAYARMPDDDTWASVRDWSIETGDAETLAALIELRRKKRPRDRQLGYYTAKLALLEGRAADGVEQLIEGYRKWMRDDSLVPLIEEDLVTALVDLERFEEALDYASRSTARDGDPFYELVVHIAAERPGEVVRVFGAMVELGYEPYMLYASVPGADRLRNADTYAVLRARYPLPDDLREDAGESD